MKTVLYRCIFILICFSLLSSVVIAQDDEPAFELDAEFMITLEDAEVELSFDYPSVWEMPEFFDGGFGVPKSRLIERIMTRYRSSQEPDYEWVAYFNDDTDEYALIAWSEDIEGVFLVTENTELTQVSDIDVDNLPETFEDFELLSVEDTIGNLHILTDIEFGESDDPFIVDGLGIGGFFSPKYRYDSELDAFVDVDDDTIWTATLDGFRGHFLNADGDNLWSRYNYVNALAFRNYVQIVYQSNDEYDPDNFSAESFEGMVIVIDVEDLSYLNYLAPEDAAMTYLDGFIIDTDFYNELTEIEELSEEPQILQVDYATDFPQGIEPQTCRIRTFSLNDEGLFAQFSMCVIRDDFENYSEIFEEIIQSAMIDGQTLYD